MNQDKVKEILLSLRDTSLEFSVTFTGKESKKVNGLYKPDTKEILIHNKNFKNDNQLVYTAIHEYAHHLECEKNGGKSSGGRCHTNSFWACFHSLLEEAEKQLKEQGKTMPKISPAMMRMASGMRIKNIISI